MIVAATNRPGARAWHHAGAAAGATGAGEARSSSPLPPYRFEAGEVEARLVGDDFCVAWETNRYSVPPRFPGAPAKVRVLEGS